MGGWWTVEARNGNGACGQSNLMRLACWLAAGQGLCERDLRVCSRGSNRRASLDRILLSCSSNDDFQAADPFYFRSGNVRPI